MFIQISEIKSFDSVQMEVKITNRSSKDILIPSRGDYFQTMPDYQFINCDSSLQLRIGLNNSHTGLPLSFTLKLYSIKAHSDYRLTTQKILNNSQNSLSTFSLDYIFGVDINNYSKKLDSQEILLSGMDYRRKMKIFRVSN